MEQVKLPAAKLKPPSFGVFRTVMALLLREMESTYGRSPGGYLWAILQPVGMIMLLAFAFSMLLRAPPMGTSFIFFFATGFLPFDIYGSIASKVSSGLSYSRPLLAYPSVTWLDALLARLILSFLTSVTVFCIVIGGVMMVVETRATLDIIPVLQSITMAALIGFGVGLLNCLLFGLWPVWRIIWAIVTRPLFLASGVILLYENVPASVQKILWWNPLIHVTGLMRDGFFPTYDGPHISLVYGYGCGLTLTALGLLFLRAHYKAVLEQR